MSKYNEIMTRVQVDDDMKKRLLENIDKEMNAAGTESSDSKITSFPNRIVHEIKKYSFIAAACGVLFVGAYVVYQNGGLDSNYATTESATYAPASDSAAIKLPTIENHALEAPMKEEAAEEAPMMEAEAAMVESEATDSLEVASATEAAVTEPEETDAVAPLTTGAVMDEKADKLSEDNSFPYKTILLIAAIALLLIVLIVVALVIHKKRKSQN